MHIKNPLTEQFNKIAKNKMLYRVEVSKDDLWNTYINSFPQGSNNTYKTRTYHDCNCCKSFIRSMGNVVSLDNGKIESIWDITSPDSAYQAVADSLSEMVKNAKISNVFYSSEHSAGTDKNYGVNEDKTVKEWEHFFVNIPAKFYRMGKDVGSNMADMLASHNVLLRSIEELTMDSVDTILDLINENGLYRGEEHKNTLLAFKKILNEAKKIRRSNSVNALDNYVWSLLGNTPGSVARIRNTAIGQLLINISSGMEVDAAVRAFESMVAPANYKRPTAIVTKAMIENAKNKIDELGLTSALNRRYATMTDISINNVIFADRSIRSNMSNNIFDELSSKAVVKRNSKKKATTANEITIEDFLNNIVPTVSSIEVMMENNYVNNLVSLIAPSDSSSKNMFKWNNSFSWTYNGDVTDSIKERVKKAGGSVVGDLCCRLAWHNFDDLDFHMIEPNRNHIYYGNKISGSGGRLDVDMNAGSVTREPVENIFYATSRSMPEGTYQLNVHQFCKRETTNIGFEVEIDAMGETYSFSYNQPLATGKTISVATINYSKANGFEVSGLVSHSKANKTVWNVSTNNYHKVNMVMLSPNYWDDNNVGNKHYFFMLDQCRNDDVARGFYNEFLMEELTPHRKVIEIVANKMKVEESENQLSGLGFSSTIPNSLMVRVDGTRTMKVVF